MCLCATEVKVESRGIEVFIADGVVGANLENILHVIVRVNKHRIAHSDQIACAFCEAHKLIATDHDA